MKLSRYLLVLVALGLAACGRPENGKPHVVLIVVDTLRADHLTQYGYDRETSGALDSFSSEATLFSAAYSTSSWTQPSVASLFTGLLPGGHGVVRQSTRLPEQFDTLAGELSEAGWQSAGWSGNLFVGAKTGFDRGFEHFESHEGKVLVYPDISDMIDRLETWLSAERDSSRPAFLYFQPMNCHGPYRVPAAHRAELLGREPSAVFDYNDELMKAIMKDGDVEARERVTSEYLESATEQYDTATRYTMDALGKLFESLAKQGLYDEALVIVTSDHGEELFEHGGFGHAYSLFEEVVRIPLWIKLPGQTSGATVDLPVSLVDLLPTVLDLVGIEAEPSASADRANVDGRSLEPLLTSGDASGFRSRPIAMDTRWRRRAVASAVRLGQYKLIEIESDYSGRDNQRLLFDLDADPSESIDLAPTEPDKVTALAIALDRTLDTGENSPPAVESAQDLDREVLKALGYID